MRFSKLVLVCFVLVFAGTILSAPGVAGKVEEVLRSSHEQRPDWTFSPPIPGEEHKFYYFVGISSYEPTEPRARRSAIRESRNKIAQFIGTQVSVEFDSKSASKADRGPGNSKRLVRQNANALVSQYQPKEWYLKKVLIDDEVRWKAFVLMAIPQQVVDDKIRKSLERYRSQKEQDYPFDDIKLSVAGVTGDTGASGEIRSLLESSLSKNELFTTIDREELETLYEKKGLNRAHLNTPEGSGRVGRMLGADALLFAHVLQTNKNRYLSLRLISVPTSEVITTLIKTTDYALEPALEEALAGLEERLGRHPDFFTSPSDEATGTTEVETSFEPEATPSVLVSITEKHNYETRERKLVQRLLQNLLNEAGYKVLLSADGKVKPDVTIEGRASTQFGIKRNHLFSVKASIQFTASNPTEQTLLASETTEAVGVDVSEPDAARRALNRAIEKIAPSLMEKLYRTVGR